MLLATQALLTTEPQEGLGSSSVKTATPHSAVCTEALCEAVPSPSPDSVQEELVEGSDLRPHECPFPLEDGSAEQPCQKAAEETPRPERKEPLFPRTGLCRQKQPRKQKAVLFLQGRGPESLDDRLSKHLFVQSGEDPF